MLEIGLFVLFITALSHLIQEKSKIPASAICIIVAIGLKALGLGGIISDNAIFDGVLLLLLPILLAVDILHLRLSDLKTHALSLFYVAGISVALSVGAGILVNSLVLPGYDISIPALVMLFCMVSATDPVAVSSVFGNYKVPHNLKVIAEGESLFNDATALVIFSIALMVETTTSPLSIIDITWHSFQIIVFAISIGAVIGTIGLITLSLSRNHMTETCILLSVAFSSFYVAEHWHYSGILAVITSLLISNHIIMKRMDMDKNLDDIYNFRKSRTIYVSKLNHERIFENIRFAAMIGITVLFLSMGDIVNFTNLILYWKEVVAVFIASTLIRVLMMLKFSLISNATAKMHDISFHWYKILVFAGVKGGLSILMLHLMPKDFVYKELFEAIVIGVILLTTISYPIMLTLIMKWHSSKFIEECDSDAKIAH